MSFTRRENILILIGYIMLILCTVSITPKLYDMSVKTFGPLLRTNMNFIFLAMAILIFYFLYEKIRKLIGVKFCIAAIFIVSVGIYILTFLSISAGDQFHLIAYIFMGFFAMPALKDIKNRDGRYLSAAMLIAAIAFLDEMVFQRNLPGVRTGTISDVGLDTLGGFLGLLSIRLFDDNKTAPLFFEISLDRILTFLTWMSLIAILVTLPLRGILFHVLSTVFFLSFIFKKLLSKESIRFSGRADVFLLAFFLSALFASADLRNAMSYFVYFAILTAFYFAMKDMISRKSVFYILFSLLIFESLAIFVYSLKMKSDAIYYLAYAILPLAATTSWFLRRKKLTFSVLVFILICMVAILLNYANFFKWFMPIAFSGLLLGAIIFNKRLLVISSTCILLVGSLYINKADTAKYDPNKTIEVTDSSFKNLFYRLSEKPFFGIGPGMVNDMAGIKESRGFYNIYQGLKFFTEVGIAGSILLLAFLASILFKLKKYLARSGEGLPKYIVIGASLSSLAFFISSFFDKLALPGNAVIFVVLMLAIVSAAEEAGIETYPDKIY